VSDDLCFYIYPTGGALRGGIGDLAAGGKVVSWRLRLHESRGGGGHQRYGVHSGERCLDAPGGDLWECLDDARPGVIAQPL